MGSKHSHQKTSTVKIKVNPIQYVRISEQHLQVANMQLQMEESKTICEK